MMSSQRARRLREWHEKALEPRREETVTLTHLERTFVVPPEVYPPHPLGLAEIVLREVRETDRVLDLGTGSGVNGIVAAAKSGSSSIPRSDGSGPGTSSSEAPPTRTTRP